MMESKLLSMMKSKFEYRLYINWWKPEFMNLKKKKKKARNGEGKGERTLVPYCDLPFSLTLQIFKSGHKGMQGLKNRNLQPQ